MPKEVRNFKNIIIGLAIVIIILLGVLIFCLIKIKDDEKEIKDLDYHINNSFDNDFNDSESNNYISREEALKITLKDAKINQNDIYDLEIELDRRFNEVVYEVNFNYQNYEYEYYINATSGKIIKSFREWD